MILSALIAATFTFTATATGVEKGTAVEFLLAGPNSDRAYESLFILDESVEAFCRRVEAAVPHGTPIDAKSCQLWPTGCRVRFEPSFDRFVEVTGRKEEGDLVPVFTGGTRQTNGTLEADSEMPAAVFATYALPQSLILFENPQDQGTAYGRFSAACTLEKGKRYSFTMTVDEQSMPRRLELTAEKGNLPQILRQLKAASATNAVDARISFSGNLTVGEARAFAQALAVIDSPRVKLNGAKGRLFYRAFLPLEKWRDRQERLNQPFELTLKDDGTDELLFIEEDWTVEGNDPKLTPRPISPMQAAFHQTTDTCFIYASRTQTIDRIVTVLRSLETSRINNWYVFLKE